MSDSETVFGFANDAIYMEILNTVL